MANERSCTLLVIESRRLRQAISVLTPPPRRLRTTPRRQTSSDIPYLCWGRLTVARRTSVCKGSQAQVRRSTFNRNRLVMEIPGSAQRGASSYTARVRRCTCVPLSLGFPDSAEKGLRIRRGNQQESGLPQDQSSLDSQNLTKPVGSLPLFKRMGYRLDHPHPRLDRIPASANPEHSEWRWGMNIVRSRAFTVIKVFPSETPTTSTGL
jgi:hypothetical protein